MALSGGTLKNNCVLEQLSHQPGTFPTPLLCFSTHQLRDSVLK